MDSQEDFLAPEESPQPVVKPTKKRSEFKKWLKAFFYALIFISLLRWLVIEPFTIPTPSMEGSLLVGDYLFVSKWHYGARTPITPLQVPLTHQNLWWTGIPSYLDWIQLPASRLSFPPFAWDEIRRNDIIVFNYPEWEEGQPAYPTDLKANYIKRCIALAGDTLEIKEMEVFINEKKAKKPLNLKYRFLIYADHEILPKTFETYGVSEFQEIKGIGYMVLASSSEAKKLKELNFVSKIVPDKSLKGRNDVLVYPQDPALAWNQDSFGPLVIPKKGMKIAMTKRNLIIYAPVIKKHEKNKNVDIREDKLYIESQEVKRYTFKQDYYFVMGDSRHNSLDSRFWGFVPEDHIVGKAVMILFSYDKNKDWWNPFRWERFFKVIR